ncbi:hypothetical protein CBM2589_B290009 [Cupriavidus taiwanensis]|uniref:Uncharacterized protein n=1 Tax=Cupriavidus taiwanensis TaxID=164546 RepID=A0A375BU24_9BURK|nr:hypothetical protein CBM2589_B290009 [Cupriavidus taiwanensis]
MIGIFSCLAVTFCDATCCGIIFMSALAVFVSAPNTARQLRLRFIWPADCLAFLPTVTWSFTSLPPESPCRLRCSKPYKPCWR